MFFTRPIATGLQKNKYEQIFVVHFFVLHFFCILFSGPIEVGLNAGFVVYPGFPGALLFFARALIVRTDGA